MEGALGEQQRQTEEVEARIIGLLTERDDLAGKFGALEQQRTNLARMVSKCLGELGTPVSPDVEFPELIAALCDRLHDVETLRREAVSDLEQGATEAAARKTILASQREQLRDLRQQVLTTGERIRLQKSSLERQVSEIYNTCLEVNDKYRQSRVQADAVHAKFARLRTVITTDLVKIFARGIHDEVLYRNVLSLLASGLFDETYFYSQCLPSELTREPAVVAFLRWGDARGLDPHPLFMTGYYREQLPAESQSENTLAHYLRRGHALSPNPLFMPSYYLEQFPGLKDIAGHPPLEHYQLVGAARRANPHPLFDARYYCEGLQERGIEAPENPLAFYLTSDEPVISPHPLFDPTFYRERYPDVAAEGSDPLIHYLTHGDAEGYDPHPLFHTRFYRLANPELPSDDTAALVHYVQSGDERRAPHPMFNPAYYKRSNPGVAETGYRLLMHFLDEGKERRLNPHPLIDLAYVSRQLEQRGLEAEAPFQALLSGSHASWMSPHPMFDVEYYTWTSAQAAQFPGGPFLYYLLAGFRRDEPVHPLFDPAFYRAQAAAAGIEVVDPLAHFLEANPATALSPHPLFSTAYYVASNPGAAGENPLLHYLTRGHSRGLDPHPLFDTAYYKQKADIEGNALLYYVEAAETDVADPHPLFDTRHYLSRLVGGLPPGTTPLGYYLSEPEGAAADPHPLFDQQYYLSQIDEIDTMERPALLDYIARGVGAPSPHALFDQEFFGDTEDREEPALAAFLDQFRDFGATGSQLHRLEIREANREFCSISYLLDHPDLAAGEVPLVHFLRGRDSAALRSGLARRAAGRAGGAPDASLRPATIEPERLAACARERLRRGLYPDPRSAAAFLADGIRYDGEICAQLDATAVWANRAGDDAALFAKAAALKRVAVYAVNLSAGRSRSYHRLMLSALRDAEYATVVIDGFGGRELVAEFGEDADVLMVRGGGQHDALSWTAALAHVAPSLVEAEHLLLVNDALVGPFSNLRAMLRRLERNAADFKGLTEAVKRDSHLQADLLLISGDAISSGALLSLLLNGFEAPSPGNAPRIKMGAELGLNSSIVAQTTYSAATRIWLQKVPEQLEWARHMPQRLEQLGLARHLPRKVAARYAAYLEDWLVDRAERVRQGQPFDPQHVFWDTLLGSPDFPFLNKELLLTNPHHVPTLIRLAELCAKMNNPQAIAALRDLAPGESGFPRSYLRLSEDLVAAATVVL